ncbi:hypothetical protein [Dolichospermum circinale]|uniref:hypothetical protein n=1 Tax=Dolichospermum circinale TaxID=109265 RepID=UPI00040FA955|nr:hypothetical protein [Dolichospermum circinale]MDB9454195.1 hypothetical protein [Dolichospermum circinale CS-541/06]MDB9464599.1 hypothetical protein [Dolichospermum circinale CS-541/04]MDB9476628.1 hypothetical protein [Dolichospermum circinale CS-537/11]MDB9549662.1 hypothetical protein [Dolichospermum circinale CS-1031]
MLWLQVQGNPKQDTVRDMEFSRRAAALVAVARWASLVLCIAQKHAANIFA